MAVRMNDTALSSGFRLQDEDEVEWISDEEEDDFRQVLLQARSAAALLVFVVGTMVNSLVLLLFHRRPTVRFFSNRFVINMTVTHLASCLLIAPTVFTSSYADKWLFGRFWCRASGAATLVLNLATVLSLLLIAVDRNYAVSSPLHYSMTVTKRRTGWLIALIWCVSVASALPPFFLVSIRYEYRSAWNSCTLSWIPGRLPSMIYSVYLSVLGFVVPLIAMTIIYCSMFRTARRSSARTGRHRSISTSVTDSGSTDMRFCSTKGRRSTRRGAPHLAIFGEEWKAARTGIIILLSFVVCWLPNLVLFVLEAWLPGLKLPVFLPPIGVLLTLAASVVDPYVYVFRNKATRKYVARLLRCGRRRFQRDQVRTLHSRTLVPVSAANFAPRYVCSDALFAERPAVLWRVVAFVEEGSVATTKIPSEPGAESIRDESVFLTEVTSPAVAEEQLPRQDVQRPSIPHSNVERLFQKYRRMHRDSTTSESTDNGFGSFDSVATDDSRDLTSSRGLRPPLKRVRSVLEEEDPYRSRREAYQMYRQESSETTTTTSSDSQDPIQSWGTEGPAQVPKHVPRLFRQRSAFVAGLESRRAEEEEARRNTVCYVDI